MKKLLPLLILCMSFSVTAAEPETLKNSVGIVLVKIPRGKFIMGTGDAPPKSRTEWNQRDWDESPAHPVRISQDFWIGATEITNEQYELFDPNHGKRPNRGSDKEPVTQITWDQAKAFCDWLSQKEGKPYRLPTEAEWEYACRAGTTTLYSTGDTITPKQANFGLDEEGKLANKVKPVGSYPPNPWGLSDMHGNVAEWCWDWYGPYEPGEQTDPVGRADGYVKVVRGWSYFRHKEAKDSRYLRCSNRSGFLPDDANKYTGFRVVMGELPKSKALPEVIYPHQKEVKQTPAPVKGPDPNKPFYLDYTTAKNNPQIPPETWGPIFSHHNHYGAVCVCPNGDVLACWYTTVAESGRELAQAASRLRAGSNQWEPASLFFDVPDHNDHAPVLFSDGKRLYHFGTQSFAGWDYASNFMRTSDDNGATWSKPRIILSRDDPHALSQPCSALKLPDGTLVLACDGDLHKDERIMTSNDDGKTWQVRKGDMRKTAGKYAIHPAITYTKDSAILSFLRGPHPMPVQISKDLGDSWEQHNTIFPGISSGQKASALRLQSGAILLVSMDSRKDVISERGAFAALSLDDGKTWESIRRLEGVYGYMAAAQAPDGTIYVFGTKQSAVRFNEAWLKEKTK